MWPDDYDVGLRLSHSEDFGGSNVEVNRVVSMPNSGVAGVRVPDTIPTRY
jgi:hypothetical protein